LERGGRVKGERGGWVGIARCVCESKRVCVHVRVGGWVGGWVGVRVGGCTDTQPCFEQHQHLLVRVCLYVYVCVRV